MKRAAKAQGGFRAGDQMFLWLAGLNPIKPSTHPECLETLWGAAQLHGSPLGGSRVLCPLWGVFQAVRGWMYGVRRTDRSSFSFCCLHCITLQQSAGDIIWNQSLLTTSGRGAAVLRTRPQTIRTPLSVMMFHRFVGRSFFYFPLRQTRDDIKGLSRCFSCVLFHEGMCSKWSLKRKDTPLLITAVFLVICLMMSEQFILSTVCLWSMSDPVNCEGTFLINKMTVCVFMIRNCVQDIGLFQPVFFPSGWLFPDSTRKRNHWNLSNQVSLQKSSLTHSL